MITAVVMVGASAEEATPAGWVQAARRAASCDLLTQLAQQGQIGRIVLVSPDSRGLPLEVVDEYFQTPDGPLHVGKELARIVELLQIERLLYFGGGSAPLLSNSTLDDVIAQLAASSERVLVNNQFATDWGGVVPAATVGSWVERLPRDNMLGWVLSNEAGLPVTAYAPTAESRLDIDTPLDLLALSLHPGTKHALRRFLDSLSLPSERLEAALTVLATPASHVFLAGRVGPAPWQALNRVSHAWIRVVSEERGMVSSGRQARGEVHSLLAAYIEEVGLPRFFELLSQWADAAFIDTRVLLAHHGRWPEASTRFASDLGLVADVEDEWLRAFTAAANAASIPVVLGGHGLMAGDLFAFSEILAAPR